MTSLSEDEPLKQNRIVLSSKKDKYGMRLAEVHYNISPNGLALYAQSKQDGMQVFKAAGTRETWMGPLHAQHIAGGTVMGSDAKSSVTDAYGRLHDVANVFIGGGSVFPTLSHANSTYTIHALAWRSAKYLAENWNEIAI
jgi:choline dehydrogenase-like flavoprotein